jgi:hypothetical protein
MVAAAKLLAPDVATRRLRIERLIGTDDTKGIRGDLGRAFAARAAGHTTGVNGMPIDAEIAALAHGLAVHTATLATLAVAS